VVTLLPGALPIREGCCTTNNCHNFTLFHLLWTCMPYGNPGIVQVLVMTEESADDLDSCSPWKKPTVHYLWAVNWIFQLKYTRLGFCRVLYVKIALFLCSLPGGCGARGSAVGWGTALQVGRSRVRFPMASFEFFIDTIPPAAQWPCGLTQPLGEMNTRNITWG